MANIGSMLRDEISRLSRREIRKLTGTTKKATAQHRHNIAALNRRVGQLERQVAQLVRAAVHQRRTTAAPSVNVSASSRIRFVAKGLRSHRNRLGLSAADFGKLIGVSANSVYAWESGTTTPRREQLSKIAALRAVGKREAAKRLESARTIRSASRRKR